MRTKVMALMLTVVLAWSVLSTAQNVKFKVLHNFGSSGDGSIPYGSLLLDPRGNLYGVTIDGGTGQCGGYGCGTVFKLAATSAGGWHEQILHSFSGGSDGSEPWGGLALNNHGDLIGTLHGDIGIDASGVFELSPGSGGWTNTILSTQFAGPGLLSDKTGNLYGSIGTGDYSLGAIGELSPGSGAWTYTQLYSFCAQNGCPDGLNPQAPPIWDSHGNLWGTTLEGGIGRPACANDASGCGVVYEMTPNGDGTWTYNTIHQFASSSTDGQFPGGGLVMDASGNFYGGTETGGTHNDGTIFKFSNVGGTWQQKILYEFSNCLQGCGVQGTLARDKAGNLYGTAFGGPGNCGLSCGVVFKLAPQANGSWKYTVLYNLTKTTGGVQLFGVILDANGNLYGVTGYSGKYGAGTAFEITP
jgi:uncharacterized repeat protein (TIGR03803 family)